MAWSWWRIQWTTDLDLTTPGIQEFTHHLRWSPTWGRVWVLVGTPQDHPPDICRKYLSGNRDIGRMPAKQGRHTGGSRCSGVQSVSQEGPTMSRKGNIMQLHFEARGAGQCWLSETTKETLLKIQLWPQSGRSGCSSGQQGCSVYGLCNHKK